MFSLFQIGDSIMSPWGLGRRKIWLTRIVPQKSALPSNTEALLSG